MLFDTDILIWVQRGSLKAARVVERAAERSISILSYMELMQNSQNREQHRRVKDFLEEIEFEVVPFSENIGHRAAIYIEEYTLASGIRAGDAIIAATAVESNRVLVSGDRKRFNPIKDLKSKLSRP
jgi:hypothetical protein